MLSSTGDKKVRGEIIIDSGAAECVMPKEMLPEIKTLAKQPGITFAAANGGSMGNCGRKFVTFTPIVESGFLRQA